MSSPTRLTREEIAFSSDGRLSWMCYRNVPADTPEAHYFSTDDVLIYDPYYGDFGPLNIAQVCRYCRLINSKLEDPRLQKKKIYHVCRNATDHRANSILLACCWTHIYENKSPKDSWAPFAAVSPGLVPYRDASLGPPTFHLTVLHCVQGLEQALKHGWYDPETFDPDVYEWYERVENGDFNWIIPGKFLAFSGPTQTPITYVDGVKTNTPETYFEYFKQNHVTGIVRFNNKVYDRKKFLDAGFNHYDLYFTDGGNPTRSIIKEFLDIAESEEGGLAIHCKAGLGRTGTLIALYMMKHYGCRTPELIGWLRLCRPGSVIGPQQNFLQEMESTMFREGELHRKKEESALSSPSPVRADINTACSKMSDLNVSGSPCVGGASPNAIRPKGCGAGTATAARPPVRSGMGSPVKLKAAGLMRK